MQACLKSMNLLQKYANLVVNKLSAREALLLYAQAASVHPAACLACLVPSIPRHDPITADISSSASGVTLIAPSNGASSFMSPFLLKQNDMHQLAANGEHDSLAPDLVTAAPPAGPHFKHAWTSMPSRKSSAIMAMDQVQAWQQAFGHAARWILWQCV